jgi:hypothetical protein
MRETNLFLLFFRLRDARDRILNSTATRPEINCVPKISGKDERSYAFGTRMPSAVGVAMQQYTCSFRAKIK